ncbi:TPA: hypothetical protein N0F65_001055 [Lagenidium giganteum]|uniref:Acyl-CoA dehydrogenase n=1 Tax=Lagenidium giganteum TaxID=4803 RepID=A0AAV2YQ77_9STRA|nr:TPA: hypothetical protein N0F65_001055 [Lagenidium giganteum]
MSSSAMLDNFRFPHVEEQEPLGGLLEGILARYGAPAHVREDAARLQSKLPQYRQWAEDAETNVPRHVQYDHWCRRTDRLVLAHGWEELKKEVAREGMVHYGYHSATADVGRLHQYTKLFIASPYMAMVTCPTAMTDGAATLCRTHGLQEEFERLTTMDPEKLWMSGQWMTERPGGSDVGNTETIAEPDGSGGWKVNGFKWFSSATEADIAFLLARTKVDGQLTPGSRGLSLFLAHVKKPDGSLNGIQIHRLKNKVGTKSLPTAELLLTDVPAQLIGEPMKGVKNITPILNITRLHAAMGVASYVHRALNLAKSYAETRMAFGKLLKDHVMHAKTLSHLETTHRGSTLLIFHMVNLLGKSEMGDDEAKSVLRLLTPMAKMFVCKVGVHDIVECMEAMGGQGYMEETGVGMLLRDGIANIIWEGATNVLALDLLRVFDPRFFSEQVTKLVTDDVVLDELRPQVKTVQTALNALMVELQSVDKAELEGMARTLGFSMAQIYIGALLVNHTSHINAHSDFEASRNAAVAWCARLNSTQSSLGARL